jgi:hypothetical protein
VTTSVLPELVAESMETAERAGQLARPAGEKAPDAAEAEYILNVGVAAIERVPRLWAITRKRIGAGMMGHHAAQLLRPLLDLVDKNLALEVVLQERARNLREEIDQEPEALARLNDAQKQLQAIRTEAGGILKMIEAPTPWPSEDKLRAAKERMQHGRMLTAEEFRRSLLDE